MKKIIAITILLLIFGSLLWCDVYYSWFYLKQSLYNIPPSGYLSDLDVAKVTIGELFVYGTGIIFVIALVAWSLNALTSKD